MITKKEFYFVRHGQTDHNALGLVKDYKDVSINAWGRKQAQAIESLITSLPIKTVCHSPLKRAKETNEIVTANLKAAQREIHDLRECSGEIWCEMTSLGKGAFDEANPEVFSFMQQARQGVNEALSHEGPVLIVAHGGIHWAACFFMDVDHEWEIDNCVPVHFTCRKGRWEARKLI